MAVDQGQEQASTADDAPADRGSRSARRWVLGVVAAVAFVVMAWLGYTVWQVYHGVQGAKSHAEATKDALLSGKADLARTEATAAVSSAHGAVDTTQGRTWRGLTHLPLLGPSFDTVGQLAANVEDLTQSVLLPAVDTGTALAPNQLVGSGGTIKLEPLRAAEPALAKLSVEAQRIVDDVSAVRSSGNIGPVNQARTQLLDKTTEMATLLRNSAIAAKIAPAMLGADGPKKYFVAFQTNTEARGTGGLVGGYGIVNATDGTVKVDKLAQNNSLLKNKEGQFIDWGNGQSQFTPIDLGPQFSPMWASYQPTTDLRNSNLSPNFPFAARVWQSIWQQQTGVRVDGAIATDPIALSYVLDAVGPVRLADGEEIRADNVVEVTMSTSYRRFATDNDARKQYLQDIASAVVDKMSQKIESPKKLLDALGRAVSEGRLAVWSADPAIEAELAKTPLAHTLSDTSSPFTEVIINNNGGNKMDYYLSRQIDYTAGPCTGDRRDSTVTVKLTNNAPAEVVNYPDYVAGAVKQKGNYPKGTAFPVVTLYATKGATISSIMVDGKPSFPLQSSELGRPMFTQPVVVQRGQTVEITYKLSEPTAAGDPVVPVQPLVDQPKVTVDVPVCRK